MRLDSHAPIKPTVSAEILQQIDVRVGTIEAVAVIGESNHLVELRVNFGDHTRTICVGMKKERANPTEVEAGTRSEK